MNALSPDSATFDGSPGMNDKPSTHGVRVRGALTIGPAERSIAPSRNGSTIDGVIIAAAPTAAPLARKLRREKEGRDVMTVEMRLADQLGGRNHSL